MNKTDIKNNYNIGKIVTAKELASLAKTYKDNLDTIIVTMNKKTKNPSQIELLIKEFRNFVKKQTKFNKALIKRLDNIVSKIYCFGFLLTSIMLYASYVFNKKTVHSVYVHNTKKFNYKL